MLPVYAVGRAQFHEVGIDEIAVVEDVRTCDQQLIQLGLEHLAVNAERTEAAAENISRALQLDPGNAAGEEMKRTLAAQKARPQ